MHVIFVVQAAPNSIGHGSNHRTYQIAYDLRQIVGAEQITVFDYGAEAQALTASRPVQRYARQKAAQLPVVWQTCLRELRRRQHHLWLTGRGRVQEWRRLLYLLAGGPSKNRPPGANRTLERYNDPRVLARYFELVRALPRPLVCVVKHSNFARLAWANRRLGIATVACPDNLEAFDVGVTGLNRHPRELYLTALNFGDELRALAACEALLFISRVETGLVNGLGLPSHYYPYRPVGAIRQNMLEIRGLRADVAPQSGLFIMMGSADHPTTAESFRWFLREAKQWGLPDGLRVIVCGRKANELLASDEIIRGIELRGWVDQAELTRLLAQAQGVLLPQRVGFGGLTRLAELSCAHVPGIVSAHATHAVSPLPPGFVAVEDTWAAWQEAIRRMMAPHAIDHQPEDSYESWEAGQEQVLPQVLAELMRKPMN